MTTGQGKYFSTGVDVSLFGSQSSRGSIVEVLSALQQLLCRLLTFPLITVAAINGKNSRTGRLVSLCVDAAYLSKTILLVCLLMYLSTLMH